MSWNDWRQSKIQCRRYWNDRLVKPILIWISRHWKDACKRSRRVRVEAWFREGNKIQERDREIENHQRDQRETKFLEWVGRDAKTRPK